jgi:hypothetical protein
LYRHVGNGRFGPHGGILSLTDSGDRQPSAVDIYSDMRRGDPTDPSWNWPAGLLPFCDWGCNIYSCVDCTGSPYPVVTYEYVEGPMEHSFAPTRDSLESWLRDWLAGIEVFEPVYEEAPESDRVIINPFTKEPMVIKGRRPRSRSPPQAKEPPMSRRLSLSRSHVQVLVALFIILLAAGMLLAAMANLREAAARTKCRNNLKQIALGVDNYNAAINRLPPLADQGVGALTGRGLPSVFADLIPYLEATPDRFDPERPPDDYYAHSSVVFSYRHKDGTPFKQEGGVANRIWRTFIDPADATTERLRDVPMTLPDGTTGYYATGSYAANGLLPWGRDSLSQLPPGGLANTVLFAERPQLCRTATNEEVYNLWGLGFYSPHMPGFATLTPAEPPELWSTGQVAPIIPLPDESAADRDSRIFVRVGRQDSAPQLPDFPTPVQILRRGRPCDPRLPGSPHSAGMQAAMADGSVRVFAPDTSPWVFWAACIPPARNGNAAGGR